MADDKPVYGPSGFGPEVEKANQFLYDTLDKIAAARRKAAEPPPHVALGISEQVAWMAEEAKKPNAVIHLGDVLDRMQDEHNRAEKVQRNANLETRTRESFNRQRVPDTARTESYLPVPFDREAAKALLVNNYPWLDIGHPDNPTRQWHRQVAEHTAKQFDQLIKGGSSAGYFLGGGQGYRRG